MYNKFKIVSLLNKNEIRRRSIKFWLKDLGVLKHLSVIESKLLHKYTYLCI